VKRYRGYRTAEDLAVVLVDHEDGTTTNLEHHRKHTPAGFEWGYLGSGPAELARCLIIDHMASRAWCSACEGTGIQGPVHRHRDTLDPDQCWVCMGEGTAFQPVVYQTLKFEVVAMWGDRWELRGDVLRLFLSRFDGRGGGAGVLHLQGVTVLGPRLENGGGPT
jgi:hypothetical protein